VGLLLSATKSYSVLAVSHDTCAGEAIGMARLSRDAGPLSRPSPASYYPIGSFPDASRSASGQNRRLIFSLCLGIRVSSDYTYCSPLSAASHSSSFYSTVYLIAGN
jgi:hypothetical protein